MLVAFGEGSFDRLDLVIEQAGLLRIRTGGRIRRRLAALRAGCRRGGFGLPRFLPGPGDRFERAAIAVGPRLRDMVFGRCRIAGHLLDHRVEHLDIEPGLFLDRTQQQQPGHDLVDLARNTAGRLVQLDPHAPVEFGMLVPADMAQAMLDIGFDLARLHRFEMVCGDDALAELLELVRMRQQLLELGLAEQQRLQQRVRTELEVRQHPQFFERAD